MERIPIWEPFIGCVEVRRSSCWHYNYEIHVIDELTICHPLFCFLQVDEDELVSDGKFGMGIPHYRMDLPEIYPVNAVSYNKAAADAKKAKEELALAQKELKERNETLEQLTPEEEKEEIQKIKKLSSTMINECARCKIASKRVRKTACAGGIRLRVCSFRPGPFQFHPV